MRSYTNPFRSRTSEQVAHQGLDRYLRTFGADALDLLPDGLWDRPVLIRSAPGAGKTSLLRAVSAQALAALCSRGSANEELLGRLRAMGALDEQGRPGVVGFRVALARDFRGIVEPIGRTLEQRTTLYGRTQTVGRRLRPAPEAVPVSLSIPVRT